MFVSAGFSQPPLGMASNPNMHLAGWTGRGAPLRLRVAAQSCTICRLQHVSAVVVSKAASGCSFA